MIISARVIRRPRQRQYRCHACGKEICANVVRLYGAADMGDAPYTIFAHPACVPEWSHPRLVALQAVLSTPLPRPSFCYQSLNLADVATEHRAGHSIRAICHQRGIPDPQRVRHLLREAGYPVRGLTEASRVRWANAQMASA